MPRIDSQIPRDLPERDLEDPALPTGKDMWEATHAAYTTARASGPLFVAGASPTDVGQGNLGSCFFLSSAAALADVRPDLLENAIRQNRDGTFTVTLFERGRGGRALARSVTVDADLPVHKGDAATGKAGDLAFARGLTRTAAGREMWPAILEKAYAQVQKKGYRTLDQGGFPEDALFALTGKSSDRHNLRDVTADSLWKKLSSAQAEKRPVVTGTPSEAALKRRTGRADLGGLLDGHAYALTGTSERRGVRYVTLFTPLQAPGGKGTPAEAPGLSPTTGRVLEMRFEDYRRLFDDVVIASG